ncbi:MAG: hypothetical protein IKR84_06695, partial [Oscillibacter sp.]|nr:hypothetical protein [Oscillibacter sp.]
MESPPALLRRALREQPLEIPFPYGFRRGAFRFRYGLRRIGFGRFRLRYALRRIRLRRGDTGFNFKWLDFLKKVNA